MMSYTELDNIYYQNKFDNERYYYQRILNAFDQQADSIYLAESILGYFEDISGKELNFEHDATYYSSLSLFVMLGIFGSFKAYSQFHTHKKTDQYYKQFRTGLSGAKNGRHAVINISNLVATFSHQSIASSLLSPAGAIGFTVGILLVANNLYKLKLEEKRNANLKAIEQYLINSTTHSINTIKPPNTKNNRKLIFTNVIDGLTDGLYVAGNIFMLLGLFGVSASVPPVAIGMAVFYGIYTLGSIINKYFKEKETQLKEEFEYLKFLKTLDKENKLLTYHDQFKHDPNYKKYIGHIDGQTDDEIKAQLKIALTNKEIQLNAKKDKFENNPIYKVYKAISKPFSTVRDYVNTIKNSLAAAAGIDILISQHPLADAAVSLGCIIAGAVLATPFLVYKTYCLIKPKHQLAKQQPIDIADLLSFFNQYNNPGFFKKRHHRELITQLNDKYANHEQNYLSIFGDINHYIIHNYKRINPKGSLYQRYRAAKFYIIQKYHTINSAIKQLYNEYQNTLPENELPIKTIKALLTLYPKTCQYELAQSLSIFNLQEQIDLLYNLDDFFDQNIIDSLVFLIDKINNPDIKKECFNHILLKCVDTQAINIDKLQSFVENINKLFNLKPLKSVESKHCNFYMNQAVTNYIKYYANQLIENQSLTIEQKLKRYEQIHQQIIELQPKMMDFYVRRADRQSFEVSVNEFSRFVKQNTLNNHHYPMMPKNLFNPSKTTHAKPLQLINA